MTRGTRRLPTTDLIALIVCGVLLFGFAVVWRINLGEQYALDYDEGNYLSSARVAMHGHALFTSVFSSQPPAFLEILTLAFWLFGDTIIVGRGVVIFFALVSLGATAWIAWRIAGPIAGPIAMLSLGLSFIFFRQARVVQAGIPAIAFALLAVGALLSTRGRWRPAWLALAGFFFSVGLLCKFLVAPMILPLLLLLTLTPPCNAEKWQFLPTKSLFSAGFALSLLAFGLGGIAACLITVLPWDLAAAYDQAVQFHFEMKKHFPSNRPQNLELLYQLVRVELGATLLAVVGLSFLFWRNRLAAVWLCLWIAATGLFLVQHAPLYLHHTVLFLPPLAIAASASALWVPVWWHRPWGKALPFAFLLPLVSYVPNSHHANWSSWTIGLSVQRNLQTLSEATPDQAQEQEAITLIQQYTQPTDYVVSDQAMQVFRAGRRVPPPMCDTSHARIRSRYLTDAQAIEDSKDARVIIFWTNRLAQLSQYRQWTKAHYRLVKRFDAPRGIIKELYVRI